VRNKINSERGDEIDRFFRAALSIVTVEFAEPPILGAVFTGERREAQPTSKCAQGAAGRRREMFAPVVGWPADSPTTALALLGNPSRFNQERGLKSLFRAPGGPD